MKTLLFLIIRNRPIFNFGRAAISKASSFSFGTFTAYTGALPDSFIRDKCKRRLRHHSEIHVFKDTQELAASLDIVISTSLDSFTLLSMKFSNGASRPMGPNNLDTRFRTKCCDNPLVTVLVVPQLITKVQML